MSLLPLQSTPIRPVMLLLVLVLVLKDIFQVLVLVLGCQVLVLGGQVLVNIPASVSMHLPVSSSLLCFSSFM